MSAAGLVVMACALVGIREPLDFYTVLSPMAQAAWIDHARNLFTEAYTAPPAPKANDPDAARAAIDRFVARAANIKRAT